MEEIISKEKQHRDLTKGNLLKKIIIYLLPLVATNVLQLLFTTMDIFTVTQFGGGNISSGAIGATTSLINLVLCVFWGVSSGISVVIGNAKGAKDYEKIRRGMGSAVLLMSFASVVVLLIGVFLSKPLLIALDTREVFLEKATMYLFVYFLGAPFNLLFNTGASILRALGDTKRPLLAIAISGVINVGLNFLLVAKLDVLGVAIATIASQAVAMIIVFLYLMLDKRLTGNLKFKDIKLYKAESLEILKHGLLNGFQAFIFNFTNVFIQKAVNSLGDAAVIGKAAASNIDGYEYALLNSISATCIVAVSQNFGAKEKKRTLDSFKWCVILELVVVTIFDLIIIALNKPLLSIFIKQGEPTTQEAMQFALTSMLLIGAPYALCGIAECCTSFLRGMKKPITPTVVSLCCIVGVRMIFLLFLFNIEFFHTYAWIYATYPISWAVCCLVYIPILLTKGKKTLNNQCDKLEEQTTAQIK